MVPRENMEPSEGALLLSGMTKKEGFQFSHAHNYEHDQTLCFSHAHKLVPYVWSCLKIGVRQERTKASHAISRGHDHH